MFAGSDDIIARVRSDFFLSTSNCNIVTCYSTCSIVLISPTVWDEAIERSCGLVLSLQVN